MCAVLAAKYCLKNKQEYIVRLEKLAAKARVFPPENTGPGDF